jgi:hypothetical protein
MTRPKAAVHLAVASAAAIFAIGCGSEPAGTAAGGDPAACSPSYTGACVPNDGYDHDCPEIGAMVTVIGPDTDGHDRDNDGYGCESYR